MIWNLQEDHQEGQRDHDIDFVQALAGAQNQSLDLSQCGEDLEQIYEGINNQTELIKDEITGKPLNLETITHYLEKSFRLINQIRGADIVLLIGNTGAGKSTMLTSLIFGSSSLQWKKLTVKLPRGKSTSIGVIEQRDPLGVRTFGIGHQNYRSRTFLPQFKSDKSTGDLYADIAGLHDTSGPLIDYINSFIMRQLFRIAKSIRLLVPFPVSQISDARGMGIREHIRVIKNICGPHLLQCGESLIPIVTKCRPANDDNNDRDRLCEAVRGILDMEHRLERQEFED